MQLHWHRRDLRVADNRALATAARSGEVLPVFVFDPAVLAHSSPVRTAFLLDALASLRERYRAHGSDLLVVRGDPREQLVRLAREHDATLVVWNRGYSGLAQTRDAAVAMALSEASVDHESYEDALLHEPGTILTNDGTHYAVYSYFWKKWRDRAKDDPYESPPSDALAAVAGDPLPSIEEFHESPPEASVPAAGTRAARDLLDAFCAGPIRRYEADRDYPGREATSRLSPHLKFGTIGVREVWAATEAAKAELDDAERDSVETFQSQLAWREFYAHVLFFRPDVVSENYREYEQTIQWREDPEALRAWKAGETGYPIVDAGMRQLRTEGFVHNRVRMVVASFLTRDLLLDWRVGYGWFRDRLVDHDAANDSGGWQWAAGTGTDAQPYFRIFNPTTQGKRFDPDAEYVRAHVPELRDATADEIHAWPELAPDERERVAPDYPAPIVDHSDRRERAIAMFEAARGTD